jgi:hypothetical protein
MARATLNWSVRDLATSAGVSANTRSRSLNVPDAYGDALTKLRRSLEAGVVVFLG